MGGEKNNWKGKAFVVLIFGVPSDMTRIEFKRKCDDVGLYCFALGKVRREGEHFRVTLTPKASNEWQRIATEKVPAWVRSSGLERTNKDKTGNGNRKKAEKRESTSSNDGGGTIGK